MRPVSDTVLAEASEGQMGRVNAVVSVFSAEIHANRMIEAPSEQRLLGGDCVFLIPKCMRTKKVEEMTGKDVAPADYSFSVNLMQFLVVPCFVLDARGVVIIWNKACERLTGIPAGEVLGTKEHWRGFYDAPRPCLSDLIVQKRTEETKALYAAHEDFENHSHGIHAENWCVMPRHGTQLYLAIDAGPIYDASGELLAVVETLRDMTSLKNAQTKLELLATHDGLTGIANRRGFDEQLQTEIKRASREGMPLSLLMVDVDHFKHFNDAFGHQAGDECLKSIALALSNCVKRPTDLVARYGGEEFAVILPAVYRDGAKSVANRIRQSIAELGIRRSSDLEPQKVVTVSIGVATAAHHEVISSDDLIGKADRALYKAKELGRDRVEVATSSDIHVNTH